MNDTERQSDEHGWNGDSLELSRPVDAIGVYQFPTPAHTAFTLPVPRECPSCPAAARQVALSDRAVRCEGCGGLWEPETSHEAPGGVGGVPVPPSAPRANPHTPCRPRHTRSSRALPTDPDKRIRAIVTELLAWHLATTQREATGGGSFAPIRQSSPTASACRVLETGVIGDGNCGTKGTWRGIAPEPGEVHALSVDRQVGLRYWALGVDARNVANAVIEDADGDRVVNVELYAGKTLPLSLPQRIGLALASVNQQAKWRVKISKRDSAPALEGMETLGGEKLTKLADRWHELIEQERSEELRAECRREVAGPVFGFDTLHRKLDARIRVERERRAKRAEVAK